jgi:hypothetical protein
MIMGQIIVFEPVVNEADEVPEISTISDDPATPESSHVQPENAQNREDRAVLDDLELILFPNPTDDVLSVRLETRSDKAVRLFLYDMNGKPLAARKWDRGTTGDLQLDLSRYAAGTYLVRIISGVSMVEKRIVKQ